MPHCPLRLSRDSVILLAYSSCRASYESTGGVISGKQGLLEKERNVLTTVTTWTHIEAVDVLVDGQMAAIDWKFELTLRNEKLVKIEELALQHWRGDDGSARIVREQYFLFPPGSTPPPETKKAG